MLDTLKCSCEVTKINFSFVTNHFKISDISFKRFNVIVLVTSTYLVICL